MVHEPPGQTLTVCACLYVNGQGSAPIGVSVTTIGGVGVAVGGTVPVGVAVGVGVPVTMGVGVGLIPGHVVTHWSGGTHVYPGITRMQ